MGELLCLYSLWEYFSTGGVYGRTSLPVFTIGELFRQCSE